MIQSGIVCVYHADCQDGFTAAWVVWRRFGSQVRFHRGIHGEPPPYDLLDGKHVIIVDFSYPRDMIQRIISRCKSLLILDHHKSAEGALADLPIVGVPWIGHQAIAAAATDANSMLKVCALFDLNRSGAGIAWNYFCPTERMPLFVQHVQDRDLWKFELNGTREISEYAFSMPYDFYTWSAMVIDCSLPFARGKMIEQGSAICRKHDKDIAELLPLTKRMTTIGGYQVPIANLPYTMASDAANQMAEGHPFAATYYDGRTHRHWSLRSKPGGVDVSEVAYKYGGGGHRHAAGFRTEIGWDGDPDWCSTGVV